MATEEGDAPGADREDDECLGGERFDEPAGPEQRRVGVEDPQHDGEGGGVEEGTDRPEEQHEAACWVTQTRAARPAGSLVSAGEDLGLSPLEGCGASHCLTQPTSAETVDESAYPYFVRREAECFGLASPPGMQCSGSVRRPDRGRGGDCTGPALTALSPSRLTWCGGATRLFFNAGTGQRPRFGGDRATDGASWRRVGGDAPSGRRRGARPGHGHLARGSSPVDYLQRSSSTSSITLVSSCWRPGYARV